LIYAAYERDQDRKVRGRASHGGTCNYILHSDNLLCALQLWRP
jgi:hypothetical protein